MGRGLIKFAWCLMCTVPLVGLLFDQKVVAQNLAVFSSITWLTVGQNILLIVIIFASSIGLAKAVPFLKWSVLSLVPTEDGKEREGTNIHLIPLQVKYLGLIFAALLAFNLPLVTRTEEMIFRNGLMNWQQGLLSSLLFGFAHCLVGVPLVAGICLTIAGIWFTHTYFVGGVELSTLHHTTYDLILVSMLFLIMVLRHVVDLISPSKKT
jgi:hypothetical protein